MNSVGAAFHILPSSTGYAVSEEQNQEKSCPRAGLVATASGLCKSVLGTRRRRRDALRAVFLQEMGRTGSDRRTFYP